MPELRIPPSDEGLEQEIIGAILQRSMLYEHVSELIVPEHFAHPIHRDIYAAMQKLSSQGQAITPITLSYLVKVEGQDLNALLVKMMVNVVAANERGVVTHAKQLYDLYVRRKLITIADTLSDDSFNGTDEAFSYLEKAEQLLFQVAAARGDGTSVTTIGSAVSSALESAREARASGKKVTGIPTGLADLDSQLGGLHNSDLVIIAGRPSMGKTALGYCIAYNAARAGYPTAFFSLEMSDEQLGNRSLSQAARVASDCIRRGELTEREYEQVIRAAQDFDQPLYIDDTPALKVQTLRARIRRMVRKQQVRLVVIDYLQLLSVGGDSESRLQEMSVITRNLKAIAKEMNIPILALSQLSRAVEQREDKRPQLSDLRESGTIEQDSDVVMFIYRAAYYLARKKPDDGSEEVKKWQEQMTACNNQAEVMIAKQRHGPIGTVKLHYDGRYTLFSDMDYSLLVEGVEGGD